MQDNQYQTISRIFHSNCEKFSSRRAQAFNTELYRSNNGSFTYGEMKGRVEKMACGLLALGFKKAALRAGWNPEFRIQETE